MNYFSILLLGLMLFSGINAQPSIIDSLLQQIDSENDSVVFKAYSSLYLYYRDHNVDSAQIFVDQAIELAIDKENLLQEAAFLNSKGHLFAHSGSLNDAVKYYDLALSKSLSAGDTLTTIKVLSNLGAMFNEKGAFDKAGEYLFRALNMVENFDYPSAQAMILTNLGYLQLNQQEFEKSIDYYNKSIEIKKELNDLKGIALLYNNIGISYYYLDILDSVLISFERSLEMYELLNDRKGQTRPLFNIGEIYAIKGDYTKALEYYKKSMQIEKEIGLNIGHATSLVYIGQVYANIDSFSTALKYQYQGIEKLKEIKAANELKDAYNSIHETFELMNNTDSAFAYYKAMVIIKDSLFTLEKSKQLNELEAIYQTEKKENEILRLQSARERDRNFKIILISAIAGLVLIIVFLWFYLKLYAKTSVERALAQEQTKQFKAVLQAQEAERKRLARELHDNVGPLLSLTQLYITELQESDKISSSDDKELLVKSSEVIQEASTETRSISHNLMPGVLIQLGLIPAIKEILNKVTAAGKYKINFDAGDLKERFDETIEITNYRIFQELLNNIIKHAEASEISVNISKSSQFLSLRVTDNGKGFNPDIVKNASGIGWKNVHSRLSLINGKVDIDSSQKGTRVNIITPIV